MPVHRFDHYNLRGTRAELDRLRDFYVDVVGLQPGPRPPFDSFGYWLYANGEAVLHLSLAATAQRPAAATALATGSFNHAAFACTGIREFETRLHERGIEFHRRVIPLTMQQQLFFQDPSGNGVELNFPQADH